MNKNFALIGAAGYIAPKHLEAIKATQNHLLAAMDKSDSVGIIDRYFRRVDFFTEFERFDRHIERLKRKDKSLDYLAICTPNYLHDAHIRFGLRTGADVICEKPIVLNPWNIEGLQQIESETNKKIHTILQLRHHPAILELKNKIENSPKDKIHDIDLTYITSRGNWYYTSWKGDLSKSGGIATNIGIHFFDMLQWIFGPVVSQTVHLSEHDRTAGFIHLEKANVRWFLSINYDTLPQEIKAKGDSTFRSIRVNNEEIEFSGGFTNLHIKSYEAVLSGAGFGLKDAAPSIQLAHDIRKSKATGLQGDYHPMAALKTSAHPFK